jgi:thiol-disulfide isomerase/thioredoxin
MEHKKHEEHHKKEKIKIKKITMWQIATGVLAVLLVLSIITGGFKSGSKTKKVSGLFMIELNDERCGECDTAPLTAQLTQMFPGLEVKSLDYSSKEGKKIYDELEIKELPALLFTEDVKDQEAYSSIESYTEQKGDYLLLKIGATFDPTKEICDNKVDDTGNGKVDCDDDDCAAKLTCNADALVECTGLDAETVIFYYSTGCPWCTKMKPGVENLEKEGYKFYSAEGSEPEAAEMIENCIQEYMTSGGVPQFICLKTGEIKTGAFVDADKNLDQDALQAWVDNCIA